MKKIKTHGDLQIAWQCNGQAKGDYKGPGKGPDRVINHMEPRSTGLW